MLINRRTLLLGALATAAASCASKTKTEAGPIELATGETVSLEQIQARPIPPKSKVPRSVAMVGDSLTSLATPTLQIVLPTVGFETVTINAEPGRRIELGSKKPMAGLDVIKFVAASAPPEMWVIALGTNDLGQYTKDSEYQALIDDVLTVIPTNVPLVWNSTYHRVQLSACEIFNDLLASSLKARGNATVGRWYQQCTATKGSILTHDGVHPNANGILVFADTVRAAVVADLS